MELEYIKLTFHKSSFTNSICAGISFFICRQQTTKNTQKQQTTKNKANSRNRENRTQQSHTHTHTHTYIYIYILFFFWGNAHILSIYCFSTIGVNIWYEVLSDYQGKYHPQEVLLVQWHSLLWQLYLLYVCVYFHYDFGFSSFDVSYIKKMHNETNPTSTMGRE